MMPDEKLSDLERECQGHLHSYLYGLTNAREFWYLVALEQEHYASREALQMMQHVGKQQEAPKPETFYCDTPDCPHPVLKPGFCAECEALHAAFDSEQQERYQSVTYYPESDITVAIGEETPFDPSHWPPEIVEHWRHRGKAEREAEADRQREVGAAQPEPAPMPPTVQYTEYKHLYCEDCGKSICFVPLNDTGHYYFCRSCQRNVRVIEDVAPLTPAEQKEAESADNWAKTIDPPSPPWEEGA